MKKLLQIGGGIIIILLLTIVGGYLYLQDSLPQTEGVITVHGLQSQVEIIRDDAGVPHISAQTDEDVFFALGYVHAQDRLWQMELQRRLGAGRLSEVFGDWSIQNDKFMRTLGVYRAAETSWDVLSPEGQATLTAYAAGVNAWLNGNHTLPVEFIVYGVEPEPWTPVDSLTWAKLMAWTQGANYSEELWRLRLTEAIGNENAAELMAPYPQNGPVILPQNSDLSQTVDHLLILDQQLQMAFQLGGLHVGSNNWVLDGSLTASGKPLLANDPHLGAQIPSNWYLAELTGDKLHVTGATFPGLPAVVIGHNDHIAWGVTSLGADVQDLYIEQINPDNPNQYEVDGQWQELMSIEEAIFVKGDNDPIIWSARSTRHGPLISDVRSQMDTPLSLRWVALDPNDPTFDSFLSINHATNWAEFTAALEQYVAPSQNFVYADTDGNIGYYASGKIPIRVDQQGLMPVPGWDSSHEWMGWIPFAEMPHIYNPASGYIATANNRVVSDDYPYYITGDWAKPYRAQRIIELIETLSANGRKITVEDITSMQGDQLSKQAQELLPYLRQLTTGDARQQEALTYLADWDGTMAVDSVAATIYQAWLSKIGPLVYEDDLPDDLFASYSKGQDPLFLVNQFRQTEANWCDNTETPISESCEEISGIALNEALAWLEDELGADMSQWTWGKLHPTRYSHNPFSDIPVVRLLFHREIPNGGDSYTVNMGTVSYFDPFKQFEVPSYRQIIDLNNLENSLFIQSTGQSGNFLSPHYDDLIEQHRNVQFLSLNKPQGDGQRLILQPN